MAHSNLSSARHHAVVIGGGLAGLLAARVLADHFESVTLIERDGVATEQKPRKGVPQGHHVHGLLAKGQEILSQLFPDCKSAPKHDPFDVTWIRDLSCRSASEPYAD
jgi:2-polyprenyl-6-methoxyphenol hydroxylase-like FAD-dependent oxidoreductase